MQNPPDWLLGSRLPAPFGRCVSRGFSPVAPIRAPAFPRFPGPGQRGRAKAPGPVELVRLHSAKFVGAHNLITPPSDGFGFGVVVGVTVL